MVHTSSGFRHPLVLLLHRLVVPRQLHGWKVATG
jgi:hypothetical protein